MVNQTTPVQHIFSITDAVFIASHNKALVMVTLIAVLLIMIIPTSLRSFVNCNLYLDASNIFSAVTSNPHMSSMFYQYWSHTNILNATMKIDDKDLTYRIK